MCAMVNPPFSWRRFIILCFFIFNLALHIPFEALGSSHPANNCRPYGFEGSTAAFADSTDHSDDHFVLPELALAGNADQLVLDKYANSLNRLHPLLSPLLPPPKLAHSI